MTKHKRHVSGAEDAWNPLYQTAPSTQETTTTFASTGCNPNHSATAGLCRFLSRGKDSMLLKELISADNSGSATVSPTGSGTLDPPAPHQEATFWYSGHKVKIKSSMTRISWKGLNNRCCSGSPVQRKIPYDEVVSAWVLPRDRFCACTNYENGLVMYSLGRKSTSPVDWYLQEHRLYCSSAEMTKEWVSLINASAAKNPDRPKNLLVFVNPFSGRKDCMELWLKVVAPLLHKARIKYTMVETLRQDHATEVIASMKYEELSQYNGIIAVGGDGLFQELVMGLMLLRSKGGSNSSIAQRMRLGHIPGGSTDACAYSLHGTRSPEAAALHIVLGDRVPLDVARVDSKEDGAYKYFVCQAAYGFLGDVLKMSEGLRAIGPSRYDVSGAIRFLQLKSYSARISYQRAAPSAADSDLSLSVCSHRCEVCRQASVTPSVASDRAAATPTSGPNGSRDPPPANSSSNNNNNNSNNNNSSSSGNSSSNNNMASHGSSSQRPPASSCPISSGSMPPTVGRASLDPSGNATAQIPAGGLSPSPFAHTSPTASPSSPVPTPELTPAASSAALLPPRYPPSLPPAAASSPTDMLIGVSTEGSGCPQPKPGARAAAGSRSEGGDDAAGLASGKGRGGTWVTVEGQYMSIMAVVIPCRSHMSKKGIIPNGHLADGRLYLVLVSKCSHLEYLRFLLTLSNHGLLDACLPYVQVIPCAALSLHPLGDESSWNIDGELLKENTVDIFVQRGLVDVFARGVELSIPSC